MKFLCKFFVLSLVLFHGLASPAGAMLLTSPPEMTLEEVEGRAHILSLEMNWHSMDKETGQRSSLGFNRKKGKTILKVQFENAFPQEFSGFGSSFTLSTPQGKKVWTYVYGDAASDAPPPSTNAPLSLEEAMGIVHPPRSLEHQRPKTATLSEIAECIRDKHCVFYTGAGISAGVVPTMAQLMKSLQLEESQSKEPFLKTLQDALKNPDVYIQPMDDFYKACLYGTPTPAHLAIRDIVQQKKWGLLTENLDLLHQRSDIKPLHHDGSHWLKSNVNVADLKKIDYVITVGLAGDESGFLGWYKTIHPGGTIIAINLQQPKYLDDKDLLVIGDVQSFLPLLRDAIDF
jgi:NAD-dependent SIR2 family protein deacetylase